MEAATELYTIFPVFLLIDVSASMAGGPIEAVNAALPELKTEMLSNPTVGEIARVAVLTFSDEGRTVVPLCDLADADIPEIKVEGGTNFAAGFRELRKAIDSGMASLPKGTPVYRPVVFFMSDGEHVAAEDWTAAHGQLRDKSWKFAPEIVAFGFGEANREVIRQVATRFSFEAKHQDPVVQVREIMNALIGSIRTTSTSFRDPSQAEGLHLETPPEYFTPLPPLQT
ncbi:MAG: VWA domain-containing protein [Actinobacteria bacterium]|nr:VWA domain-containing protein [Actinomycetota bacterium]